MQHMPQILQLVSGFCSKSPPPLFATCASSLNVSSVIIQLSCTFLLIQLELVQPVRGKKLLRCPAVFRHSLRFVELVRLQPHFDSLHVVEWIRLQPHFYNEKYTGLDSCFARSTLLSHFKTVPSVSRSRQMEYDPVTVTLDEGLLDGTGTTLVGTTLCTQLQRTDGKKHDGGKDQTGPCISLEPSCKELQDLVQVLNPTFDVLAFF
mmetsp:Transcript_25974/g.61769  ORF Transcript_25974/g.61769 Transcript_25974/m.61769 type:complete len:206 (-) Transcript_25974:836-1453(-)